MIVQLRKNEESQVELPTFVADYPRRGLKYWLRT